MLAQIRKIGNSKGIILPKWILVRCGIKGTVEIIVRNKTIIISAVNPVKKKKWSDFKNTSKVSADFVENRFDKTEWTW